MSGFTPEYDDCSRFPLSINLTARKKDVFEMPKMIGVTSVPRLGFTDQYACLLRVVRSLNLDMNTYTGAFWNHRIECAIEDAIEAGSEWILTVDYDSIYTVTHVHELCREFARRPELDALAPIQIKRVGSEILASFGEEKTIAYMDSDTVVPVNTAHFGLTLLRASALKDLPKPWFRDQPNKDGQWREGKIDADIAFWSAFRAAGKNIGLMTNNAIGHAQVMVTWPDRDFRIMHQHIEDFAKNGPPAEAR
jgi:hypothetical protein